MSWFKSKQEKELERLRNLKEIQDLKEAVGEADVKSPGEDVAIESNDFMSESQVSPLADDGTPFIQLRGEWDNEQQGFKIELDWNAPFLKHIIAMGVEGESDYEVGAYGVTLLAHQIIEQEQIKRANELASMKEVWDEQ